MPEGCSRIDSGLWSSSADRLCSPGSLGWLDPRLGAWTSGGTAFGERSTTALNRARNRRRDQLGERMWVATSLMRLPTASHVSSHSRVLRGREMAHRRAALVL